MAIVNSRAAIEPKTGKAAIFVNETIHSLMRKLFSNGEQGFFYDPNDLSTMYQDAAGIIPVTAAGQPAGLMLDKSKGLIIGNNVSLVSTATKTADGVQYITLISDTSYGFKWFDVEFTINSSTALNNVFIEGFGGTAMYLTNLTLGVNKIKILVGRTGVSRIGALAASRYDISNITVKEVAGNHAYQSVSAMRPLLVAAPQRLDYDAVDDKLITNLPVQLTGCTVVRSVPNVGTQILTNQTIPTTYNDNTDHCGLIVINRALTATETSQITKLFNKAAGV